MEEGHFIDLNPIILYNVNIKNKRNGQKVKTI